MDPPQGAVRLTSVIGGRNPAYRTAVGKALLSDRLLDLEPGRQTGSASSPSSGRRRTRWSPPRPSWPTSRRPAQRGFGIDDQENEIGVNCVAIPIHLDGSASPSGAISVSAVTFRCPLERLVEAVPGIRETIARMLGPNALG